MEKIDNTLHSQASQYDLREIIENVRQVRDIITISSKRIIIQRIGKVLSEIRLKGITLFKLVMKESAKELAKEFAKSGWQFLNTHMLN
ncbi:MAG: hypothetical protein V4557_14795 [Bacteroidota bacterium]